MLTGNRRSLGEILVEKGLITRAQLRLGLVHHHETGVPLGRALVREGLVSEEDVLEALSTQLGIEAVDLRRVPADRSLARFVPAKVARQYRVVPLRLEWKDREILHVALPAPASLEALDAVRAVSGKPRVEPHLASDTALARALATLYGFEELAAQEAPLLKFSRGEGAEAPVLLYGWPPVTAVLLVRTLAMYGIEARSATPLEVMHSGSGDVVLAPLAAMEGLLVGEAHLKAALLVHGEADAEDYERARAVGATGYLSNPRDEELLVRAIRRLRSGGG
ncbi:general secretion pathway protein GspE [Myxococcaceae bacterium GXIMD 01537]